MTTDIQISKKVRDVKFRYGDRMRFEINYNAEIYKESVNRRAFSLGHVWSSIGGFVGMFLGYSLLQVV